MGWSLLITRLPPLAAGPDRPSRHRIGARSKSGTYVSDRDTGYRSPIFVRSVLTGRGPLPANRPTLTHGRPYRGFGWFPLPVLASTQNAPASLVGRMRPMWVTSTGEWRLARAVRTRWECDRAADHGRRPPPGDPEARRSALLILVERM